MRILITGNLGFVGGETERYLESQKIGVIGYDIMDGFDIKDLKQLDEFVARNSPDRILHLAAIARFSEADKNPKLAFETNVIGTANVATIASKYHIPVVYASTGSVYMPIKEEPPITEEFNCSGNSVYGCTKYLGEIYIKACTPHIILRYAHLYGKEKRMHGLIGGYLSRITRGIAPTLYGGKQSNDFCYIKDVARANYLALIAPWDKWNQAYNIGTGEELSAKVAGDIIINMYNIAYPDQAFEGDVDVQEGRTVDPGRFVYDMSKAEKMLNFKADFSFRDGMADLFTQDD